MRSILERRSMRQPARFHGAPVTAEAATRTTPASAWRSLPVLALGLAAIVHAAPTLAQNELVSVNSAGTDSANESSRLNDTDVGNGAVDRFVVFRSDATDLTGDTDGNGTTDIFLHDSELGTTVLVSLNSSGAAGNGRSSEAFGTPDGQHVAFRSQATDLDPADTDSTTDAYAWQASTGSVELVSVDLSPPTVASPRSHPLAISHDGRYVLFSSEADGMTATPDTNGGEDLFVRDLQTQSTTLVSVNTAGTAAGNGTSTFGLMSADGCKILFASDASDLTGNDNNAAGDAFLRDLCAMTPTTTLVSLDSTGTESANAFSFPLFLTDDARWALLISEATDLVTGVDYSNGVSNLYLRDLQLAGTQLVTFDAVGTGTPNEEVFDGGARVSQDGRFVLFRSPATNLTGATDANDGPDVFWRDMSGGVTHLVSVSTTGDAGDAASSGSFMGGSGRFVLFNSGATDLAAGDAGTHTDIFVRDMLRGLTVHVTRDMGGGEPSGDSSFSGTLSSDDREVTFSSEASDLGPTDTNMTTDVFRTANPLAESVDFGDAPASYATRFADDGAAHVLGGGLFLGALADGEPDGLPAVAADGDDLDGMADEEGVLLPASIDTGTNVELSVTASAAGLLNAWVDFDLDGAFESPAERVFTDQAVVLGANALSFAVPDTAGLGASYARFRLASLGGLTPTGLAMDGEVEDYPVTISLCQENVTRSNETIVGPQTVKACDTLTLDPNVAAEGAVTFRAGALIGIGNGFQAAAGANVAFEIDPTLLP